MDTNTKTWSKSSYNMMRLNSSLLDYINNIKDEKDCHVTWEHTSRIKVAQQKVTHIALLNAMRQNMKRSIKLHHKKSFKFLQTLYFWVLIFVYIIVKYKVTHRSFNLQQSLNQ